MTRVNWHNIRKYRHKFQILYQFFWYDLQYDYSLINFIFWRHLIGLLVEWEWQWNRTYWMMDLKKNWRCHGKQSRLHFFVRKIGSDILLDILLLLLLKYDKVKQRCNKVGNKYIASWQPSWMRVTTESNVLNGGFNKKLKMPW